MIRLLLTRLSQQILSYPEVFFFINPLSQVPVFTSYRKLLVFSIILHKALNERGLQYKVVETKPLKKFSSEYLLSYVIPLIAFDFTQWQDMIKFLIIWGFLFLLCWRFWQMPIAWLSMLGFFVSECDLETYDGQLVQKIIISRKPLSRIKGELVTIADIDNNQAIQIGEHLDKK